MLYIIVAALFGLVVIFGIAAGMQSYATAEQAHAQIEVAQVAQVNAWGNLIVILVLALVIVLVLAIIVWIVLQTMKAKGRRMNAERQIAYDHALSLPPPPFPYSLDTLIKLEELRLLRSLQVPSELMTPTPTSTSNAEENDLSWLRREP